MRINKQVVVLFLLGIFLIAFGLYISHLHHPTQAILSDTTEKTDATIVPTTFSPFQEPSQLPSGITVDLHNLSVVTIAKVLDGDTVVTQDGEKIRYLGINAPENGQPMYAEAKELNASLTAGKQVGLAYDIEQKDRYGRTLAYVYSGPMLINLEIVKQGLAVSETIQPNVAHQDEIAVAQQEARAKCLGIWSGLCSKSENSCIKITTINANPKGDDTKNKNGEWIKFANSCSNSIDLNKYLLKDSSASNSYTFHNVSLSANASVKLHSGCGSNSSTDLYWQCPEQRYAIWNNSGDHAYLYNAAGELVNDYQY